MPIEFKKSVAALKGVCTVEEAETLLEWLLAHPRGRVNLKECEHLHTAVLQVLLACRPALSAAPADPFIAAWVAPALQSSVAQESDTVADVRE